MFKRAFLLSIVAFGLCPAFAKSKPVVENLDPLCNGEDRKSTQTAVYSLRANADSGLILCSSTTLQKTNKHFKVISFQKSKTGYDQKVLFTSNDLMSYQIHGSPVDLKIKESLTGKPRNDSLFAYTFSCINKCEVEGKDCTFPKREKTGEAVKYLLDNEMKMQKLNRTNNVSYEKKIRVVFLDALAGNTESQEYFKSQRCGWNHYIDIDEQCTTYENTVEENTKNPCKK